MNYADPHRRILSDAMYLRIGDFKFFHAYTAVVKWRLDFFFFNFRVLALLQYLKTSETFRFTLKTLSHDKAAA